MTLESRQNFNRYIGNGVTTDFPFTFKVWNKNQVNVVFSDNQTVPLYSVFITETGGTISFVAPPQDGVSIIIIRNMPYIQEDDYVNGSRFDGEEIEDRFDQDCAERQDLRFDVDRALKVPLTSSKSPEQYQQEFWDAYADNQSLHDDVVSLHADMVAEHGRIGGERAEALQAVQNEGDHQVQRVQGAADVYYAEHGSACMEMNWTINAGVSANTDIDISPLSYIVGRHHMQVSVNGVQQYRTKQFNEKGTEDSRSSVYTTLVDLNAGDTVNVWIGHLAGGGTATEELDGMMSKEDKAKLDLLPAETSFARTTTVLQSAVSAGTAITVPEHAVGQGLLMVFHNGVLCDAGGQYTDETATTIKFLYDIPAGDTITAAAVAVSAS